MDTAVIRTPASRQEIAMLTYVLRAPIQSDLTLVESLEMFGYSPDNVVIDGSVEREGTHLHYRVPAASDFYVHAHNALRRGMILSYAVAEGDPAHA